MKHPAAPLVALAALLALGCAPSVMPGPTPTPTPGLTAAPGYVPARHLGRLSHVPQGGPYRESVLIETARELMAFQAALRDTSSLGVDFERERVVALYGVFAPIPACTGEEAAFRDDPNEIVYAPRVVGTPPPQPCAVAPMVPGDHFAVFALAKGPKPVKGVKPFAQVVPLGATPSPG